MDTDNATTRRDLAAFLEIVAAFDDHTRCAVRPGRAADADVPPAGT